MNIKESEYPTSAQGIQSLFSFIRITLSTKDYKVVGGLGTGYFGIVLKVQIMSGPHKNEFLAVKKIDMNKQTDTKMDEIRKKMLLLNVLNHPNILPYKIAFVHQRELWVVFSIMDGGSIESMLKTFNEGKGIQDIHLIATIVKETLQGLDYLHKNNQIHRDIKSANILFDSFGHIAISDFGLTTKLKKNKKHNTAVGSVCWMAPEVLDDNLSYDTKADIWSLGITAYEIAYGKPPHSECSTMKAVLNILNEEPPRLKKEDCWDETFEEFIIACLQKDPKDRKSSSELLQMKFFKLAKNGEYMKEKLIKKIPPLDQRIDPSIKNVVVSESIDSKKQLQQKIQFDFTESKDAADFENLDNFDESEYGVKVLRFSTHKNDLSKKAGQSLNDFGLQEEEN